MATQTALPPVEEGEEKKSRLGWLLNQIAEEAPGLFKEEEGTMPSQTLAKMWAFAGRLKGSKFLNAAIRDDHSSIFYLIAKGHEMGAKWTHAVQSLYQTPDGKVGIQGDLALAVLLAKGFRVFWPVQDEILGVCQICRPQCSCPYDPKARQIACVCGHSQEMRVTLEQMDKMGFSKTRDGQVKFAWKDPRNMLRWRSFAYAYRLFAADVLGGLYLFEEIQDMDLAEPDKPEDRMETVAQAAGTAETSPAAPDEALIDPALETQFREAAFNAGKKQAYVAGQIAIVEGKIKAALAKDPKTDVAIMAAMEIGILMTGLQPKKPRTRQQQAQDREAQKEVDAQGAAAEAMEARTGLSQEDVVAPALPAEKKKSLF